MASDLSLVQYIVDQLSGAGAVTFRKMFGEYGLYLGGKLFALVCDDRLLFKITEAGGEMAEVPTALPYPGAKPHFWVENVDDRMFLTELTRVTCEALPMPKPKK